MVRLIRFLILQFKPKFVSQLISRLIQVGTLLRSLLKTVIGPDEIQLPRSNDHRRNFLDAIRTGAPVMCPIETAVRSDAVCHQADIAIRLGQKLRWDPVEEAFIDNPEANRMLSRPMRGPWHL